MHNILAPLTLASACRFPVFVSGSHWNCHPTVVSYWFNSLEGMDISDVKHGGTVFSCMRCMIRKDDICNVTKGEGLLEAEMEAAYKSQKEFLGVTQAFYKKGTNANAREKRALSSFALNRYSSNKVGSMLQVRNLTNISAPSDGYSILLVDPLIIFCILVIQKTQKI